MNILRIILISLISMGLISCGDDLISSDDSGGGSGHRVSSYSDSDGDSLSYTYDSSGRLISQQGVWFGENYSISYRYNDLGQRSSAEEVDGTDTIKSYYIYADDGKLTEVQVSESGETHSITYEYNGLGQLTKETNNAQDTVTDYFYNNNEQLIRSVRTDSDGPFTTRYIYNSSGHVSEFRYRNNTGYDDSSCFYSYNNAGQMSKVQCIDTDSEEILLTSNYNYESATCTAFFDLDSVAELLFGTSQCKP